MQATLIHNPRGGSANDGDMECVASLLAQAGFSLDLLAVAPGSDAGEHARRAVREGSHLLIASGGDGTVSAVASAAINCPDVNLAILPHGTANSIAAHLGIPTETEAACDVIMRGKTRVIDTARVNDHPMVLLTTLGVHADAVTEADQDLKRRFGPLAYVIGEVQKLVDHAPFEATIQVGDERFMTELAALTVANMASPANLLARGEGDLSDDDGLLDVTLVSLAGPADALATTMHLAYHVVAGLPADRDNVAAFRASSVRIETSVPVKVMVDGDIVGMTPIQVDCIPRSLSVLVP